MRRLLALIALIAIGCVAQPAQAAEHTAKLTVGKHATWRSPETFRDATVLMNIYVGRKELSAEDVPGSDCAAYFYGSGVAVLLDACGDYITARIANVTGRRVRVRLSYGAVV